MLQVLRIYENLRVLMAEATRRIGVEVTGEHVVNMQVFVADMGSYTRALPEIGAGYIRHLGKWFGPTAVLPFTGSLYNSDALAEIVVQFAVPI